MRTSYGFRPRSEVLFGLIKEVMKRTPDLKLVVMHGPKGIDWVSLQPTPSMPLGLDWWLKSGGGGGLKAA